jgi:hypothetical protein
MTNWLTKLPDGRCVFYPWGQFMRGYVITEQKGRRLIVLVYLWVSVAISSTIAVYRWKGLLPACFPLAFWLAVYFVWMGFLLRRLQRYEPDPSNLP